MGEVIASRQQTTVDLVNLARQWLADHADDGPALQRAARREMADMIDDFFYGAFGI